MASLMALSCLKCGGKLQIRDDISEFTCPYCNTPHVVNPDNGMISLSKIEKSLKNMEKGVDKTAAELAIRRIKDEILELPEKGDVYLIKSKMLQIDEICVSEAMRGLLEDEKFKETGSHSKGLIGALKYKLGISFSDEQAHQRLFNTLDSNEISYIINQVQKWIDHNSKWKDDDSKRYVVRLRKLILYAEALKKIITLNDEIEKYKKIVNS